MKRSKHIKLALISAIPFALAACGGDEPTHTVSQKQSFDNVQACVDAKIPVDVCSDAFMAALAEHRRNSPSYTTQAACEADFVAGYCNIGSDGQYTPRLGGFELTAEVDEPDRKGSSSSSGTTTINNYTNNSGGGNGLLTGLILGHMLSDNSPRYYSEPVYYNRDSRGQFARSTLATQIQDGHTFSQSQQVRSGNAFTASSTAARSVDSALGRSTASSTSRGGFGKQATARSGWGSSSGGSRSSSGG